MDLLAAISWPILPRIELGPLAVSPHGLGIAVGYLLGGLWLARRAERAGIDKDDVWNMLTRAVFGVVIGARLFYVIGHITDYVPDDPLGIFRVWEGGIVFYGGVFGGILAAYPYARRRGIVFPRLLDAAAPGFAVGLIVGRIGDLIIGDHLGGPTSLPFGFRYEGGELPGCPTLDPSISCPAVGDVVHQTALYDWWSAIVMLPLVLFVDRRKKADGVVIAFAAVWYGVIRFLIDYSRSAPTYLGFRGTQWVSLTLAIGGVAYLAYASRRGRIEGPAEAAVAAETEADGAESGPAGVAAEDERPVLPAEPEPSGEDTRPSDPR